MEVSDAEISNFFERGFLVASSFYISPWVSTHRGKVRTVSFCVTFRTELAIWYNTQYQEPITGPLTVCTIYLTANARTSSSFWKPCLRTHARYTILYLLSKDEFVNVMGKHRAGWEHTGISGRHDGSRHSTQTNEWHSCWCEVLKHHGKDQSFIDIYRGCLVCNVTLRWFVERSLGPIWGEKKSDL